MTISFFVENQTITRTDTENPATNSICYLKAKFEFGNDWNATHNICPRFRAEFDDAVYVPALVNGRYLNDEGICFVPIEILQKPGRFLVSVTDETDGVRVTTSETYVTVVKGSSGMYSPTIQSLDLQYKNEETLLQLTANGKAVGSGVTIPAPKETFVKTYFDYAKLKDVAIGQLKAFSINDNLNQTNTNYVYIRFELIKDKLDESAGALVVQPVLTGLPSVIYGSTSSERTFDRNEKIGITLRLEEVGIIYDFSEEDFKEIFSNENTVFNIDFDNSLMSFTIIRFEFRAIYNDIDTANAIKSSIKNEILPMFRGIQVAIDRVEWTEKESEIVYVE